MQNTAGQQSADCPAGALRVRTLRVKHFSAPCHFSSWTALPSLPQRSPRKPLACSFKRIYCIIMNKTNFEPNYRIITCLGYFIVPPLEIFLLWQIIFENERDFSAISLAAFLGLFALFMPYRLIRRITFTESSFLIEKYFWAAKTIDYADVVDIGTTLIKTQSGNVSLYSITNANELYNIFITLIENGKINRYQIENKIYGQEVLSRKAFLPAILISLVLQFITSSIWSYEKTISYETSLIIIFLPTYFMTYYFFKNQAVK